MPALLQRARAAEDGFTFPELAVAASMLLLVSAAALGLILVTVRQNDSQADRVVSLDEARNGLMQMTNEVRSAAGLRGVSPQKLDVYVWGDDGLLHQIRYKCVGNDQGNSQGLGGTCSRQDRTLFNGAECADDGAGPGCVVILRNVVKYGTDSFAEPCLEEQSTTTEERQFCVHDNRTVQFSVWVQVPEADNPIEVRGAATVRNCMTQQEEAIPCVEST